MRPSAGPAGSGARYLAYRSDVFHRGAPFESPGAARFILAVGFKQAGQDWIGYDQSQSRSTGPDWTGFAEQLVAPRARAVRVPAAGSPHLGRRPARRHRRPRYPRLDLAPVAPGSVGRGPSRAEAAAPAVTADRTRSSPEPAGVAGHEPAPPEPDRRLRSRGRAPPTGPRACAGRLAADGAHPRGHAGGLGAGCVRLRGRGVRPLGAGHHPASVSGREPRRSVPARHRPVPDRRHPADLGGGLLRAVRRANAADESDRRCPRGSRCATSTTSSGGSSP